jgi:hypothetical protein
MALWGPPTITDDEPKPVPATWFRFNRNTWWSSGPSNPESGDAARAELAARLMPDYASLLREPLTRQNWTRMVALIVPAMLIWFVASTMAGAGNIPFWAVFAGAMLFMMIYYRWWFARELIVRQQQAIATALAEGCCAACLYGLREVDRTHEKTICPECGATWNTVRIGTLRGAITHERTIRADEAKISENSFGGATQGFSRWFFGDKWLLAPTVVDARGRRVRLVHGKVFARSNRETRLSETQLIGARKAMTRGRVRAALLALWLTSSWVLVLWLQVSMVMKSGMGAGLAGLWQVIVKLLLVIAIPIGFIAFMRQYYPRLRGWKPSPPQPAADALAQLSICACCGEPLTAQPEEDGATVCGSCGASWKTGPQASKP